MNVPRDFCFVAPWGYGPLSCDRTVRFVGGAEVQQAFLAAALARRGHAVTMVTMDFGQVEGVMAEGVRILKTHRPSSGVPGLRFIHPRLSSLWSAMKRADAEIYYQRSAGALTGLVAAFARSKGRKFIYAAASDLDFDPTLGKLPSARDRALCRYGMRNADAIIVQTDKQRKLCRQVLGRDAVVAPSCFRLRGEPSRADGPILWVGTFRAVKRPEIFLDLAERLPGRRFVMVGGSYEDAAYADRIHRRALELGNVECVGHVHFADIEQWFDRGALLINTSIAEGFPNTFLQAWSRGMPTVSFFDPELASEGDAVACVVSDVDAMAAKVEALLGTPQRWAAQGQTVKRYFERHHSVESSVAVYESIAADLHAVPPLVCAR